MKKRTSWADIQLETSRKKRSVDEKKEKEKPKEHQPLWLIHQPTTLSHIIGNDKAKRDVATWFDSGASTPLLLTGPVGIGKTSLARVFLASKQLVIRDVRALPGDFLQLLENLLFRKNDPRVGIIVDDVETLDPAHKAAMTRLLRKPTSAACILISNDHMSTLKNVCTPHVRMFKPMGDINKDVRTLLRRVQPQLPMPQLCRLENIAQGDMRAALNALEFQPHENNNHGKLDPVFDSPFDVARVVLTDPCRAHVDTLLDTNKPDGFLFLLLYENYTENTSSLDAVVAQADLFSAMDMFPLSLLHVYSAALLAHGLPARASSKLRPPPKRTTKLKLHYNK